jgi:hypothetical protein
LTKGFRGAIVRFVGPEFHPHENLRHRPSL